MIDLLKSIWPVLLIVVVLIVVISIPDSKSTDIVDKFLEHKFKTPNTKK